MRMIWVICGLLLCLLTGCGGGGNAALPATGDASGAGTMQLAMSKRTALSAHPLAQVSQFRIVVTTANGTEFVREVSSDATFVEFTDLPTDADVTVTVEARNRNAQAIERGSARATIRGGATTGVDLSLQQVPIFTNLTDGAVVVGSQVRPEVLAAPGGTVRISQTSDAAVQADLVDLSVGRADVSVSLDGLVQVRPAPLVAGHYQLRVEDAVSGESSQITVTVVDHPVRPAPLFGAVSQSARGQMQRLSGLAATRAGAWPFTTLATRVATQ